MTDDLLRVTDVSTERAALTGFLDRQRRLVRWRLEGADDATLRPQATPSGMNAHGVVRHLENVERSWFRDRFAGENGLSYDWTDADPDGEFHVPSDVPMSTLLDAYDAEWQRCNDVIADADLDRVGVRTPHSLRWLLLHMIEETARHLGHVDLLREQADGGVGYQPRAEST